MKHLLEFSIFDNLPEEAPAWVIVNINKEPLIDVSGGRAGSIHATFDELATKLGSPIIYEDADKTQAEWFIEFQDGKRTTIYDYKADVDLEEVDSWSIGGSIGLSGEDPVISHLRENFPKNNIFTNDEEMENMFRRVRENQP